jgi:hypothetical protein
MTTTLHIYNVPKQDVLDCNAHPFVQHMTPFVLNPTPDMADSFAVLIDGYNDVDDEIYTIPEIRAYWQELDRRWPYILFFGSMLAEMPQMVAWCCLNNLSSYKRPDSSAAMIDFDRPELAHWIHRHFPYMNALYEAACGENIEQREWAIYQRTNHIFQSFNLI